MAEDTCATRNLKYKGIETDVVHVQAAVLAALKDTYAKILTTDEIIRSFISGGDRTKWTVGSAGRPINPPALPFKKES